MLTIFKYLKSRIIQYFPFCDWLISLSIMSLRFVHVAAQYQNFPGLPYDPAIPLVKLYPKELKTGTGTDIYTSVLIEYDSQ